MNVCYIAQEKVFYYVEHKNEAWSLDQPGRERTQYCLIAAEWIWKQVESKQEEKKIIYGRNLRAFATYSAAISRYCRRLLWFRDVDR